MMFLDKSGVALRTTLKKTFPGHADYALLVYTGRLIQNMEAMNQGCSLHALQNLPAALSSTRGPDLCLSGIH